MISLSEAGVEAALEAHMRSIIDTRKEPPSESRTLAAMRAAVTAYLERVALDNPPRSVDGRLERLRVALYEHLPMRPGGLFYEGWAESVLEDINAIRAEWGEEKPRAIPDATGHP